MDRAGNNEYGEVRTEVVLENRVWNSRLGYSIKALRTVNRSQWACWTELTEDP